ncbi:MAG TPA: SelB C-terminal domain-containing protein, partial [Geobacteraceae bacterium]
AKRLEAALAPLLSAGEISQVVREPRIFLSREALTTLKELLVSELDRFLADNPMKDGIGKEELKTRLPRRSDQRFFTPLLAALEKEGRLVVDHDLVKLPGRSGVVAVDLAALQARIEQALQHGGCEPPTIRELCDQLGAAEKGVLEHLNYLAREGRAVKVKSDVFYAPGPVAMLQAKLVGWLQEKREITPTDFRELTGLSRKFMIPLLEYFDSTRLTIRVGDKRLLRKV